MKVDGQEGSYTGEINEKGEPHGDGCFTSNSGHTWKGTFYLGKANGFIHRRDTDGLSICGEMKDNRWDGKQTRFSQSEDQFPESFNNLIYVNFKRDKTQTRTGVDKTTAHFLPITN